MLQARRLPPQNREMKVAAAQISCVLGGFGANLRKIRDFAALAKNSGAELVVFPEMVRMLVVKHGANVIVNSSAWPVVRAEHLRILALSRAVENQSYFIIANRVGSDDGVTFCGSSVIVDPSGKILAAASVDREEIICDEISKEIIGLVRDQVRIFEHRRADLY